MLLADMQQIRPHPMNIEFNFSDGWQPDLLDRVPNGFSAVMERKVACYAAVRAHENAIRTKHAGVSLRCSVRLIRPNHHDAFDAPLRFIIRAAWIFRL